MGLKKHWRGRKSRKIPTDPRRRLLLDRDTRRIERIERRFAASGHPVAGSATRSMETCECHAG